MSQQVIAVNEIGSDRRNQQRYKREPPHGCEHSYILASMAAGDNRILHGMNMLQR
jgi:hypothetical protein